MREPSIHPLDVLNYDAPLVPMRLAPGSLPALRRVGFGLSLLLASTLATIALSIAAVLMRIFASFPTLWMSSMSALNYVAIGCVLVSFAGKTICLGAPREIEAHTYLYSSFAYMLIAVCISLVTLFLPNVSFIVSSISQPAQLISTIFFILFLRELALFLEAPQLAKRTTAILIGSILACALLLIQLVLAFQFSERVKQAGGANMIGPSISGISMILGAVMFVYFIIVLFVTIKYALLLNKLRIIIRNCRSPPA